MATQPPPAPGRPQGSPPGAPPSPRPHSLWPIWVILLIWNAIVLWPRGQSEARIPYSAFVGQVEANNVSRVHMSGDAITGSFTHPFTWPQPAPAPSPGQKPSPPASTEKPRPYQNFGTTFPQAIGDTNLMPLLREHHVEVDVAPPPSPWISLLLANGLPFVLLIGFFLWMSSRAMQNQSGILGFGRSRARSTTSDRPTVTFNDVAGADEAKIDLLEVVDFLRNPKKYHAIGARIPRGVLLVGPPGTGKTLLARAVAGEAGVPFFSISASEFVEMFVGVGASRVRDLFEQAKAQAPAIVFIDELDAVGRRRGAGMGNVNDEREQTLNQLLVEMDGFDPRQEVILLAATNRPDVLDPALLRPGRFDRQVEVALPDKNGRAGILKIHTRALPLAPDVDLTELAAATTGFSGADLANLCNEAALVAARENHQQVSRADFFEAQDKVILGRARHLVLSEEDRRVIAYHEGGHALVAWLTPNTDPVQKVTIIPRGRALGVTEQVPKEDRYNYSREYLLARLAVMLGGRTAEELAFGDITTGAENDLVEATRIARRMVTRWGMGGLGEVAFAADEEQPFLGYELARGRDYSEATAARVDQEVQRILAERHEEARRVLTGARDMLDRLAEELLRHETIEHEALIRILGPRTTPVAHTPAATAPAQLAAFTALGDDARADRQRFTAS